MNIVPPIAMPTTTAQAVSQPVQLSREERQHDLLLHQMIRATVEEGGQDKVLLRFGERKLWVETHTPLRSGDRLSLQVIETHPELKLRILDTGLLERLGRSLHLLGQRLDVAALTDALLKPAAGNPQSPSQDSTRQALSELLAALRGTADKPIAAPQLQNLSALLGLGLERQLLSGLPQQAAANLKNALLELQGHLTQNRSALSEHLQPLLKALASLPQLASSASAPASTGPSEPARQWSNALLGLLRLHSNPAGRTDSTALVQQLGEALARQLEPFAAHTQDALARVQQVLALLPDLLPNPAGEASALAQLDPLQRDLLSTFLRLLRGGTQRLSEADGQALLKRLAVGFEKEFLAGFNRLQDKSGAALSHLELWQMCRARMGEIGVDFVPLPLGFLDHGFLIARRHAQNGEDHPQSDAQDCSLSLFLELEGLGHLQIDCLYQEQGLYLKFSCRDPHTASFLAAGRDELVQALGEDRLCGASFAAAADSPDQALIRRLIPAETSFVSARV